MPSLQREEDNLDDPDNPRDLDDPDQLTLVLEDANEISRPTVESMLTFK